MQERVEKLERELAVVRARSRRHARLAGAVAVLAVVALGVAALWPARAEAGAQQQKPAAPANPQGNAQAGAQQPKAQIIRARGIIIVDEKEVPRMQIACSSKDKNRAAISILDDHGQVYATLGMDKIPLRVALSLGDKVVWTAP